MTDASGAATATLDFPAGVESLVEVEFAGDTFYRPTRDAGTFPEAARTSYHGNCGTEFELALFHACPEAGRCGGIDRPVNHLFFTGEAHTMVAVEVPGSAITASVEVAPSGVGELELPESSQVYGSGDRSENVIRVRASREVCVQGMSLQEASTDAFLGIPVQHLGTEHVVMAWAYSVDTLRSVFTVVGTADGTTVTITPSRSIMAGADTPSLHTEPAGVPFTVTLDSGEAMAFRAQDNVYEPPGDPQRYDVTGTIVESSAPVAVFGGHMCAFVPSTSIQACDYLIEQLPSVDRWGSEFLVTAFATRLSGYVLRVVAAEPGTEVRLDGTLVATLGRGELYQLDEPAQVHHLVTTSHPALVAQYSKGVQADWVDFSDPFMTLVVPTPRRSREVTHLRS